ncbi:unnamed protein product [Rotaria sordida]|uniref:C2 domain-containing protein n=2 Tax=Rotaria sordida TaxID=392033 RepID=A0A818Q422_9BILA|nr:unnamed protein product [Rotaria sordida]CAF3634504.1 unnamed protein product [Rotaria sordida]
MDFTPARDTSATSGLDQPQGQAKRISNERQMIAKLDPAELQDRYLRLYDDHLVLKQHARKQEDKIKKLATKLTKVIEDKKKSEAIPLGSKLGARETETENLLAEYRNKISQLSEQNKLLKQRIVVSQQQLQAAQQMKKSATIYDNVTSRIDTGQPKRMPSPLLHNIRVIGPRDSLRTSGTTPRINSALIEDARMANKQLEESLEKANQQLNTYEQQMENLRQQLQQRDNEFEQNLLRLKAQATGGDSRTNLQENIDMIRLQRDLRDKSDELRRLQTQCTNFESQNRSLQVTNAELLKEIDRLDRQIKDEQQRALQLRTELRNGSRSNTVIQELNAQIEDFRRECEVLKEANTKLVSSAFSGDRDREFREKERALKLQIAQLEATLKADLGERGNLLDRLTLEKDTNKRTDDEHRAMHLKYLEMKEKYDDLAEKMRFFEKESDINMKEIEEALILLRQRKQRQEPNFDFLQKVDDEKAQNLNRRVLELESQLAETANELEKTRNLLFMQYKINRDYKLEVDCVQRKMDENQAEHSSRVLESGQLLDIRADRIRKLEKALKDVAYGTRQYRIQDQPITDDNLTNDLIEEAIELERGQNLIEIHISRASFNERALEFFGKNNEPSTFCSIEFFEHELQMTPIVRGRIPEYHFTAQYIVNVDDFLLYYLQKEYTLIELHQTVGQSFQTIATCKLSLKQLIEGNQGRLHGTAKLIASHQNNIDIGTFGVIEYWIRLRVPMEQAFRLLKEKMKAQGYLVTTSRPSTKTSDDIEQQREMNPNMNELTIAILNCSNVKAATPDHQPDLYCIYKFYDFADHDTITIPSSNNPNFDDRIQYPVQMDADLDRYLKQSQLTIFVFDDRDQKNDRYVARADIPLIPLSHDNQIRGTFNMRNDQGENNGTMDVTLKWTYSYLPPSSSTRTPAQRLKSAPTTQREPLALLPDESVSGHKTIAEKQREMNVRLTSRDVLGSDSEQRPKPGLPRSSSGSPSPSSSQPVRNGRENYHQRTSSNASSQSKRVSFDNREGIPTRFQNGDHQITSESSRAVSPESSDDVVNPSGTSTRYVDESDPDIIYQTSTPKNTKKENDVVTIGVHDLVLNDKCSVFDNDNCEKVFVSVEFLDYPQEALETPYALVKGEPNTKYSFNFQTDFSVRDQSKKHQLSELIGTQSSGEIKFVVVGEPPEDQPTLDCVDVGVATINAKQLLQKQTDLIEKSIDVYGIDDNPEVIGQMNVTVSIVQALNKITREGQNIRRIHD